MSATEVVATMTPDGKLTLRPMTDADLDQVIALDSASHLTPWTEANFRDALTSGNLCIVAEHDGTIVGCVILQLIAAGDADLLTFAVMPSSRRGGVGRKLLREAISSGVANGIIAIVLEVRESNSAAIELYRDAGFLVVGARKGYYERGAGREDAITMRLDLIQGQRQ